MARDDARRAARERRHLTLLTAEPQESTLASDEAVEVESDRARVRAALDELSPRDREVLLLWDSGLSYEEIAAQTGLARGAIGTTLSRARRWKVRLPLAWAATVVVALESGPTSGRESNRSRKPRRHPTHSPWNSRPCRLRSAPTPCSANLAPGCAARRARRPRLRPRAAKRTA